MCHTLYTVCDRHIERAEQTGCKDPPDARYGTRRSDTAPGSGRDFSRRHIRVPPRPKHGEDVDGEHAIAGGDVLRFRPVPSERAGATRTES